MIQTKQLTRFVVAGCSRSGTTYMAKLLSALGLPCGHERIFNIWRIAGIGNLSEPMAFFFEKEAKQGDASFLSIPYLDQLPEGTIVLHQVRNPLEVIRSHMGIRFFSDPYVPSIYLANEHPQILDFLRAHCAEIMEADTEIGRCMRYWYHWNRIAERAESNSALTYLRYRVEDVDVPMLSKILSLISEPANRSGLDEVMDSISKRTNTRPRDNSWTWDNLPSGEDKERVLELSRVYRYL
jgi:hypothetical protein